MYINSYGSKSSAKDLRNLIVLSNGKVIVESDLCCMLRTTSLIFTSARLQRNELVRTTAFHPTEKVRVTTLWLWSGKRYVALFKQSSSMLKHSAVAIR